MIKKWCYNDLCALRPDVKALIRQNNYKTIDIGASMGFWSYPECHFVADSVPPPISGDCIFFNINLENKSSWSSIIDYTNSYGKFDFSICSHTLEDVFNPIEIIDLLQKISQRGYIEVPSKYNECTKLYINKYRGNAHHKQIIDVYNDSIIVYPKFSWIETDNRTDLICSSSSKSELSIFWERDIPVSVFGNGIPFTSDDDLINTYYLSLLK